MVGSTTLYAIPLVLAAGVSFVLFVLTAMHHEEQGAYPMMGFLGSISIWAGAYALQLTTTTMDAAITWSNVKYFGIALAPIATLIFALEYTGRDDLVTTRIAAGLLVVPLVTNVVVWTNSVHELWAAPYIYHAAGEQLVRLDWETGIWYTIHVVYSYVASLAAAGLFVRQWLSEEGGVFTKTTVLLVALVFPMLGSAVTLLGTVPLDVAPFTFTISGAAIVATIFYF